jgi:hypothetical protein
MKKSFFCLGFILMLMNGIFSQKDTLLTLGSNAALYAGKNPDHLSESNGSGKKLQKIASLSLLFFDDFSEDRVYPNPVFWQDSNVYVNRGFPRAPFTVGAATFDGLNKYGYPYNPSAPASSSGAADVLTSQPLDMSLLSPADCVYISFYYQAKGWANDAPDAGDSLILEFFKPAQNSWGPGWKKAGFNPGVNDSSWNFVLLSLTDTAYFKSNFQFRFRNKATLSGAQDQWHLDYVYLRKGTTVNDTLFKDHAFGYEAPSLLRNYSSMPWWQFASGVDFASSHPVFIRNNDPSTSLTNMSVDFKVFDETNTQLSTFVHADDVVPFEIGGWNSIPGHANPPVSISTVTLGGPVVYKTRHSISANDNLPYNDSTNDILTGYHPFFNYYSFDDGTAEAAYSLTNSFGAMMAVQIKLNTMDTLKAVDIYFDPFASILSVQNLSYNLVVWSDNGGVPGTILYQDPTASYPYYYSNSQPNTFVRDTLTTALPLSAGGTYYVGIKQVGSIDLNIGFDRNYNYQDKMFYNVNGNWNNSSFKGSYMMRPVMRSLDFYSGVQQSISPVHHALIYPNPARNQVTINHTGIKSGELVKAELYDLSGRIVLQEMIYNNQALDISSLTDGVYILRVTDKSTLLHTGKLFIAH